MDVEVLARNPSLIDAEYRRRFLFYEPHDKQDQFHSLGAVSRERLFLAGNRVGKTLSGAAEFAIHATEACRPGSKRGMARWSADRAIDAVRDRFGWEAIGYGPVALGTSKPVPDEFRQLAEKDL